MIPKVIIYTEGGFNKGFGHITRCLSIYDSFVEKGIIPKVLVDTDESTNSLLVGRNFEISNWINQTSFELCDISIIDSYFAEKKIYKKIVDNSKVTLFFDDYNRITYPKGIIINPSLSVTVSNYNSNENELLIGAKYIPLRKEFWNVENKKIKKEISEILITIGGSDINFLSTKILGFLNNNYNHITKNVIIGSAFKNIDELKKLETQNVNFVVSPSTNMMSEYMQKSDIAISAAGQTLFELGSCGTPTIAILEADNQQNNINAWLETGFIDFAGNFANENFLKKINELIINLQNPEYRKTKSILGKKVVDGKGSDRISEYLLKKINHV